MSIATELTKLQTNLSNAYVAAKNKNATMPDEQTAYNLSSTIDSIQQGQSDTGWTKPNDWPDLPSIVSANMGGKQYAIGMLFNDLDSGLSEKFYGQDIIVSDGQHYTSTTAKTFTLTMPTIAKGNYAWVVCRSNDQILWNSCNNDPSFAKVGLLWVYGSEGAQVRAHYTGPIGNSCSGNKGRFIQAIECDIFGGYNGVAASLPHNTMRKFKGKYVFGTGGNQTLANMCYGDYSLIDYDIDIQTNGKQITSTLAYFYMCYCLKTISKLPDTTYSDSFQNMFYGCQSLEKINKDVMPSGNVTTLYQMYYNSNSIKNVPEFTTLDKVTSCASMFTYCRNLVKSPKLLSMPKCTTFASLFSNCISLEEVQEIDTSAGTTFNYMFNGCYKLRKIPTLNLSKATNLTQMFINCYSLEELQEVMDLPNATTITGMFSNCYNLKRLPDTLNLPKVTSNCSTLFSGCSSLKYIPTHLTINVSVSFAASTVIDKDSIATFGSDGEITGGMVYNLNTCTGSNQTITFSSTTKGKFTADQQSKISAMLTGKNWGIVW